MRKEMKMALKKMEANAFLFLSRNRQFLLNTSLN